MKEIITSEVFQVGGPFLTSPDDAAIYLITIGDDAALVDAGCGPDLIPLIYNLHSCGVEPDQVRYLLITHCHIDHTGGASAIKSKTGCKIVAHEKDAVFLEKGDDSATAASWYGRNIEPVAVDIKLTKQIETIELSGRAIKAIHTPGHSPGSVVYLMESEGQKILFGQDIHGPLHPILHSDQDAYVESLKKIRDIEADILCEGHFGIFRGKEAVARFIESYMK